MTSLASHLRSNTVAYLALLVALGGTSYAATSLPRNSVGSAQIRNGAVTTSDVKDKSLRKRDFKKGELPTAYVAVGTENDDDPAASPQATASSFDVVLPAGRRIEIEALMPEPFGNCSPPSDMTGGLYLDGKPVPDTRFFMATSVASAITVSLRAVTKAGPGKHTVSVGLTCAGGVPTGYGLGSPTWRVARVG